MNIFIQVAFFAIIHIGFKPINGNKCINDLEGIAPHNLYFETQSLDLTFHHSDLVTQQLFNEIIKILLEEVLGYQKIKYVHKRISSNCSDMVENYYESTQNLHRKIPNVMINLDVQITSDLDYKNFLDYYLFTDCGNVAPSGRYGWFVPNKLSIPGSDHWEYFLNPMKTSVFDLNLRFENEFPYLNISQRYCDGNICTMGFYVPDHCKNLTNGRSCGILLAPYFETTEFIIEHINELKLFLKVIWFGKNLRYVVNLLTHKLSNENLGKSLVFLEWTPNVFTFDQIKFKSVYLPRFDDFKTSSQKYTYEITKTIKLVWSEIKNIAKPIFETIYKMSFDSSSYENLLQIHNGMVNESFHDSACEWLRQSKDIWSKWLPLNLEKKNIYIGGIFPLTGVSYNAQGVVLAARMAQDAINQNATILKDFNLKLLVSNGQCQTDMVLKTFIDYIFHNEYPELVGILGPACSETLEPLAGVSKHYSTIIISYSAEGSNFSDTTKYPYFFRSIGENDFYKQVYLNLFQTFEWQQIAALTEDGQKSTEYISSMGALLSLNDIHLIANMKFPRNSDSLSLKRYLEELKEKHSKIIIADIYDNIARTIMCHAYNLNMIGKNGYVWFLPSWLAPNWYNTTHFNYLYNETVPCSVEDMYKAIKGYFTLEHAAFASDDSIMQENISVATWRKKYLNRISEWSKIQNFKTSNTSMLLNSDYSSNYAGYAYDAVWIYALAVDQLARTYPESLSDIHSDFTTKELVKNIRNIEFDGVSGKIKFYNSPSRLSVINIKQWDNESVIVGQFFPNVSKNSEKINDGILHLNISKIKWQTLSGVIPTDGFIPPEKCLLRPLAEALNISCANTIVLVNVICFGILGGLLLTIFIVMKNKYDKRIKLTEDYMKAIGFDKNGAINLSSLDKWETARECVVINRKLGEGAFGTVYGGEAILSEGEGWVAVAVKTLKMGSSREEKLDFLSEAESMKRFDHKNIVKLLGVCTKNEPFYTIMEYMLYGDLKTYLLARRHLINETNINEKEEISNKKLTSMALDIARALSYLAELKYVHRDVACRNCLVNAQRVVKLGDFGMSRLIFENDYYRFNRKGMLPVRWMAPESLCLGIFSPASDVWSFAILLYEIITFGNFPFQGMSNNEVLEYVKSGQTLSIPAGVKPQLEGLMKSCWNMDYKKRPNASEIAEFLANSPRLLSPCLDVPLSSVEMDFDDIDVSEMNQLIPNSMSLTENNVTNVTMPSSMHFDNPTYIVAEISKIQKLKKSNKNTCKTSSSNRNRKEESEPFI